MSGVDLKPYLVTATVTTTVYAENARSALTTAESAVEHGIGVTPLSASTTEGEHDEVLSITFGGAS